MMKRILIYITPTWVTSLLLFTSQYSININLGDGNFIPPLQRHNDEYTMDLFLNSKPNYNVSELRSLNRVRLYLQVYSRACLSTDKTSKLDTRLLYKRTAGVARTSTLDWPFATPKSSDWTVWAKAVKALTADQPNHKMGSWIGTHQRWPLNLNPPTPIISTWLHTTARKAEVTIECKPADRYSLHEAIAI